MLFPRGGRRWVKGGGGDGGTWWNRWWCVNCNVSCSITSSAEKLVGRFIVTTVFVRWPRKGQFTFKVICANFMSTLVIECKCNEGYLIPSSLPLQPLPPPQYPTDSQSVHNLYQIIGAFVVHLLGAKRSSKPSHFCVSGLNIDARRFWWDSVSILRVSLGRLIFRRGRSPSANSSYTLSHRPWATSLRYIASTSPVNKTRDLERERERE